MCMMRTVTVSCSETVVCGVAESRSPKLSQATRCFDFTGSARTGVCLSLLCRIHTVFNGHIPDKPGLASCLIIAATFLYTACLREKPLFLNVIYKLQTK